MVMKYTKPPRKCHGENDDFWSSRLAMKKCYSSSIQLNVVLYVTICYDRVLQYCLGMQ